MKWFKARNSDNGGFSPRSFVYGFAIATVLFYCYAFMILYLTTGRYYVWPNYIHVPQESQFDPVYLERDLQFRANFVPIIATFVPASNPPEIQPEAEAKLETNPILSTEPAVNQPTEVKLKAFSEYAVNFELKTKNIVFGSAIDVDDKQLESFGKTMRKSLPDDECILIVNQQVLESENINNIASTYNLKLIPYAQEEFKNEIYAKYDASTLRWILYDQIFKQHENQLKLKQYEKAIILDVNNILIEDNPFALIEQKSRDFHVFTDCSNNNNNDGNAIMNHEIQYKSIKNCFGPDLAQLLEHFRSITPSVVYGTMDMMMSHVNLMNKILLGRSILGRNYPKCEFAGSDQGVLSVLTHMNILNGTVTIHERMSPFIDINEQPHQQQYQHRGNSLLDSAALYVERNMQRYGINHPRIHLRRRK